MHKLFKVLGDENRYKIFTYLVKNGESCVCDLEELLDIKQANLSKHLGVMSKESVLATKQVGKYVHYRISNEFQDDFNLLINLVDSKENDIEKKCDCK
jgi:ArsR family transcriptional regulator